MKLKNIVTNMSNTSYVYEILEDEYNIHHIHNFEILYNKLFFLDIDVILIEIDSQFYESFSLFSKISSFYPNKIKIAFCSCNYCIEIFRLCGKAGFDKILNRLDLPNLKSVIKYIDESKNHKVTLIEIGIIYKDYHHIVSEALWLIEKNYVEILSVNEIVSKLSTTYKTLSDNFKKSDIVTPKEVLTLLKLRHALYLLKKGGLSIKEVSYQSGFTSNKRFLEIFKKKFGICPTGLIKYLNSNSIADFWNNYLIHDSGSLKLDV